MKKILFPTAHSKFSKNTWRYALRLAQFFDAQITLMHVYEDSSFGLSQGHDFLDEDMLDDLKDLDKEKYEDEYEKLNQFAAENTPKQYHSIAMDYVVTVGNVVAAILQEEQENNYDLIVLGTSTTNRFSDALFGSTSLKILAQSKTAIFLVPPMVYYRGINKIVYATNFESGDAFTLQRLADWMEAFRAELHLLHINKNTVAAKQAKEKMEKLINFFEQDNEVGMVTFQFIEGNIAKGIENYLETTNSDMIALTTHKRGFFAQLFDSSVTNQIATEALVPILIFKQG